MPTYERSVHVAAPLEAVWEFSVRVSGLQQVTPDWLGLRVESIRGPDGESDRDELAVGTEVDLSVAPFGLAPRQHWTSRIVERRRDDGAAYFRDEMVSGPFPRWEHAHLLYRDGGGTLLRDRVRYRLPLGTVGRRLGPLAVVGLEPLFRYRHRRTKELLE